MVQDANAARLAFLPDNADSLKRFRKMEMVAWKRSLHLELPEGGIHADAREAGFSSAYRRSELRIGRASAQDEIRATLFTAEAAGPRKFVILAHPRGVAAYLDDAKQPSGLAKALLARNISVLLFDAFMTGPLADAGLMAARNPFTNFFTTYNRTVLQERVQDLVTLCAFARGADKGPKVFISGEGPAGLWALLAAPMADGVVADADGFDGLATERWLRPDTFTPAILAIGGIDAVASLAAPNPLTIHGAPATFAADWLHHSYQAASSADHLKIKPAKLAPEEIVTALEKY